MNAPSSKLARHATEIAVLVAAIAAAIGVAIVLEMRVQDGLVLAGVAVAASLVAGALGVAALRWTAHGTLRRQVALVAVTAVTGVAAGAFAAAEAMFLSAHDLGALAVVLVASAGTSGAVGLALARRLGRESGALAEAARAVGNDSPPPEGRPRTQELAAVASELTDMSRRLEESRRRERALDASRRELVAWVSHDLRSPLAAIRAVAEALEDGVVSDPDTVDRYHRTLRREAERLTRLVDDLFELSRTQAGALELELERVSLEDVVSEALAGATPVARAKGVLLEGRLEGDAPAVQLSPREVSRALRNVLENAIRHTPSDGTVRVVAGTEQDRVFVTVEDACGGIPDEDLDRVFDVAFRGTAARTPGGEFGAGLGLAIARGIVEAHDGDIDVSNAGPGCRFTIRLPSRRST